MHAKAKLVAVNSIFIRSVVVFYATIIAQSHILVAADNNHISLVAANHHTIRAADINEVDAVFEVAIVHRADFLGIAIHAIGLQAMFRAICLGIITMVLANARRVIEAAISISVTIGKTEYGTPNIDSVHLAIFVGYLATVAECDTALVHGNVIVAEATEHNHVVTGYSFARGINLIVTGLSVNDKLTIAFIAVSELDRDNRDTLRDCKVAIDTECIFSHSVHNTALHATVTHRRIYIEVSKIGIDISLFIRSRQSTPNATIICSKCSSILSIHSEFINVSTRCSRLFRFSISRSCSFRSRSFTFRSRFFASSRSFTSNRCFAICKLSYLPSERRSDLRSFPMTRTLASFRKSSMNCSASS